MKLLSLTAIFILFITFPVHAQSEAVLLQKTAVKDTILGKRTLILRGAFNGQVALRALFPGKYYNLSQKRYKNELINWECKKCQIKQYPDVNEDAIPAFPFAGGVATRLINVMEFKDATGNPYKIISFNHSEFDEEGMQTSRFTGGLLGVAKFVFTAQGWQLTFFQPAIAAYGAFAQCPKPKPVLIGENQYAFMIAHSNGGGGGPFDGRLYLIAGAGGRYQQVMAANGTERTSVSEEEDLSSWSSTYSVPVSAKKYFRDILVEVTGVYTAGDHESLPMPVRKMVKPGDRGAFTFVEKFVYTAAKGYRMQQPLKVVVKPHS